jgi:16S rRNA (uracil1498-N3)-methyltransferase
MTSHLFLFYSPDVTATSARFDLGGNEHYHLTRVLRCRAGDELYVTNGSGLILRCRARRIAGTSTEVETISVREDNEPGPPFVLALAVLKKDKFERALEQCVELGITRCVPFKAQKSQIQTYSPNFMSRLEKVALAAMKQSFRSFLTAVDPPRDFDALPGLCATVDRVVVGGQGAPPVPPRQKGEKVMVVVGPEAGLSDDETAALTRAGAREGSVSPFRLRSETAAAALVVALGHPV